MNMHAVDPMDWVRQFQLISYDAFSLILAFDNGIIGNIHAKFDGPRVVPIAFALPHRATILVVLYNSALFTLKLWAPCDMGRLFDCLYIRLALWVLYRPGKMAIFTSDY